MNQNVLPSEESCLLQPSHHELPGPVAPTGLHRVHRGAAVLVPQVYGFGHDGIRVLLRYLECKGVGQVRNVSVFKWKQSYSGPSRELTLHRNLTTASGRLMPRRRIL